MASHPRTNNVAYIFAVLGSDHPSLIEAYLQRQQASQPSPQLLNFQHEFPALSAADGYARVTGQPQCVLVHVDVGTAALGQALHNASTGRVPVLIFAGLAPSTLNGEIARLAVGACALVSGRAGSESARGALCKGWLNRAVMMATSGSPGPVDLTATREVLASSASEAVYRQKFPLGSCRLPGWASARRRRRDQRCAPLCIEPARHHTGYLGRNHAAVHTLIELADLLQGIRVLDSEMRYMSFPPPTTTPPSLSFSHNRRSNGSACNPRSRRDPRPRLRRPLDPNSSPTHPLRRKSSTSTSTPVKSGSKLFDLQATATFWADAAQALRQLVGFLTADRP
ncbi:acetolactate synthase [Lecanosticta acicola]|uniref:Acetolactate synthase n=1 Tax=Lecanosticta acicola TaxID=111012 RepID=A0AAI8YSZ5_9PEZI|nr:acetolactate synthase [Lecanosticta acicola]